MFLTTATSRFLKYVVVGTIAFVIDLGLLLALVDSMPLVLANTVAFAVANIANFILGHVWVFQRPAKELTFSRYAETLAVSVIGLALNDLLVWVFVELANVNVVTTKVIATVIVLAWNYTARIFWIYREGRVR
jgi:putative flippase GtrA